MEQRLTVVELESDEQIDAAFSLMAVLRPSLRRESFVGLVRGQGREFGYRLAGGFDVTGRLVVLAGYKPGSTLSRGAHLFVDDLVTAPDAQGRGHGRAMLIYLARRAREMGLPSICLDSRATARGFYEKVGFEMWTAIPCGIGVERLLAEPLLE
jgi:GNAT superfamily N-acetyltransferase